MKTKNLNKLISLYKFLNHGSFFKEAAILKKASPEGVLPDFKWLNRGHIGEMSHVAGLEAFDEFIELNSDKFAVWNPIKYLGSGMVGDAWELDDGKVLKIFDNRTGINDFSKYKNIMNAQWEGSSNLNFPMIYELGYLKMPTKFYQARAPSRINYSGSPDFAYVVMEKVKTPQSILDDRLEANPNLLDPYKVYNEEADEWVVPKEQNTEYDYDSNSGESQKVRILKLREHEVPRELSVQYYKALADEDYDYFLSQFVRYMFNNIISQMRSSWESSKEHLDEEFYEEEFDEEEFYEEEFYEEEFYEEEFGEELDEEELDEEEFGKEDNESLDTEERRNTLIDDMVDSIERSKFYTEESLNALERELNLAPGWERELAEAVLNNLAAGRSDLHELNFGLRNGKFVFFDA